MTLRERRTGIHKVVRVHIVHKTRWGRGPYTDGRSCQFDCKLHNLSTQIQQAIVDIMIGRCQVCLTCYHSRQDLFLQILYNYKLVSAWWPCFINIKKKLHESGTVVNLQISLSPSMSRLLVKGINWINEAILNGYRQSRCFFCVSQKNSKMGICVTFLICVNPSLGFEKFLIENNNKGSNFCIFNSLWCKSDCEVNKNKIIAKFTR